MICTLNFRPFHVTSMFSLKFPAFSGVQYNVTVIIVKAEMVTVVGMEATSPSQESKKVADFLGEEERMRSYRMDP